MIQWDLFLLIIHPHFYQVIQCFFLAVNHARVADCSLVNLSRSSISDSVNERLSIINSLLSCLSSLVYWADYLSYQAYSQQTFTQQCYFLMQGMRILVNTHNVSFPLIEPLFF